MSSRPSTILVRRFEDLDPEVDLSYFARGFQEDLTAELTRFAGLEVFVPARAGEDPATEHELAGSIRRTRAGLAVHAQLTERSSGRAMWAQRFDVGDGDLFALQGRIASEVAGKLAASLDNLRLDRARRAPPTKLAAYDLWLRGRAALERGSPENDLEARDFFQRALALDPQFGRAYAGVSLSYFNDWSCQSWHLWKESEEQARVFAERAVELDDGDALVHIVLARVQMFHQEYERARASVERALALNPNDADVNVHAGHWIGHLGDTTRALELCRRAMELNPRHGAWYHVTPLWMHVFEGQYEDALREGLRAGGISVDTPAITAVAAAHLGRASDAAQLAAQFHDAFRGKVTFGRAPAPGEEFDWILEVNPLRLPEHRERLAQGLRAVGIAPGSATIRAEARPADLSSAGNRFVCEGDVWQLAYAGRGARLVGVKGFFDLARLLAEPQRAIHCLELSGAPATSGADDVLDSQARREIGRRIEELTQELEEAESTNDVGRIDRARSELDALTENLAGALGLGGRARKLGDAVERARSATTWRIRSAIRRVAAAHPELGQHLDHSIRTGVLCTYRPERPTAWEVEETSLTT